MQRGKGRGTRGRKGRKENEQGRERWREGKDEKIVITKQENTQHRHRVALCSVSTRQHGFLL